MNEFSILAAVTLFFRDATHKMPGDELNGPGLPDWSPRMEIGEEMKRKIQERWWEYGFV